MRKIILTMLVAVAFVLNAAAQDRTITGRIIDEKGVPVVGVSVLVKGTKLGTQTTSTGEFSVSVPSSANTLLLNSVGYASKELKLNQNRNYTVVLSTEAANLQEVVVVGYSTSTKEAFTGTAKVVTGERLQNKSVSNVSQALAGEVAGVSVINTTGQPGTSATIRVRGIGSVNGNRAPLYVVDGVPFSGVINSINPADIATLTVLKDAAATSIYGSRGANGVIVITTKNGKGKKSFIELDGKYSTNKQILPRYDVIRSPEEFIGLSWEGLYNRGVALNNANPTNYANTRLFSANGISPSYNMWNVPSGSTGGAALIDPTTKTVRAGVTRKYDPENWADYAFQPSTRREGNIRMGGGDSKTNYFTSFGYLKDEGYIVNSDFERISARLNLNHEVKSWLTTSTNIGYSNSTSNNNGQAANSNSIFWFADNLPSIFPLFLRDANGAKVADPVFGGSQYDYGIGRGFGALTNAIADATYNTIQTVRNDITGNTSLTLKFTKNLSLENRLGVQYYNNAQVSRNNKFYGSSASQGGSISQNKTELLNTNLLNLLRYGKRFGSHNLEVLAAHEATNFKQTLANASGNNLVENGSLELNNAVIFNPSSSYANTNKIESYFSQVNYDYLSKYYVSATIRKDGSSRFTKGNAFGTFGSVGLGWDVTKMAFMKRVKVVDYLKLKASYGVLGDQDGLGYYPGVDRYDINNLNNNPSFTFNSKGNPDLTWETSRMFQTGVEFRLGSFLTGSVDYYKKKTENLIFNRRTAISLGYAIIQVNDGKLENKGVEFDLTAHLLKKKDYFLDLGVNGENFTNKITAMPIDPTTGKQKPIDVQGSYAYSVGHSIFDFYVRSFSGVDPTDGTSTWKVFYEDLNGDGKFNSGEQVLNLEQYYSDNPSKKGSLKESITKSYAEATQYYVGQTALPKLRGAVNLNGGFKGFTLSVQMLYSFGGYAYDGAYSSLMQNVQIGGNNWSTDIRNRWQKPGDVTDVPRISSNYDANVSSLSSRFITKANYISLNNIRLGYELPRSVIEKIGFIEQASFFVSGDNLYLKSKRNGFNPSTAEDGGSDIYRYAPLSTITVGFKTKF